MCVQYNVDVFIVISNSYVVCGKYLVWQCWVCHVPYSVLADIWQACLLSRGGGGQKNILKEVHTFFAVVKLGGWDLAERLERLAVNATVATVLGSVPASSDTVESDGAAEEAVLNNVHKKIQKIPFCKKSLHIGMLRRDKKDSERGKDDRHAVLVHLRW